MAVAFIASLGKCIISYGATVARRKLSSADTDTVDIASPFVVATRPCRLLPWPVLDDHSSYLTAFDSLGKHCARKTSECIDPHGASQAASARARHGELEECAR